MPFAVELEYPSAQGRVRRAFENSPLAVGRSASNDVVVPDARVSGTHAEIVRRGDGWFFRDLFSTNGSAIERDGRRTAVDPARGGDVALAAGDKLLLGDVNDPVMIVVAFVEAVSGEPAPAPLEPEQTVVARRRVGEESEWAELFHDAGRVRRLFQMQQRLDAVDRLDALWETCGRVLEEAFPAADGVGVYRRGPREESFETVLETARDASMRRADVALGAWFQRAVADDRALMVEPPADGSDARLAPFRAALVVPLRYEGAHVGVLCVATAKGGRPLHVEDLDWTAAFAMAAGARMSVVGLLERLRADERRLRNENRYLRRLRPGGGDGEILGRSAAIEKVRRQIDRVAAVDVPVLILGETGTGKELAARAVHARSRRGDGPFAAVNCGAIPEPLLESELFGHTKGAFTGAVESKKGLFEVASGGVLFLDELGDMPLRLQVKLLRVLAEGEIHPVGAVRPVKVDVRIVAATNRDLELGTQEGWFRADLFYRINTVVLELPPLRARGDDVLLLADSFYRDFAADLGRPVPPLGLEAREFVRRCEWPGNIRQLRNEIQRVVLLADEDRPIEPGDFSPSLLASAKTARPVDDDGVEADADAAIKGRAGLHELLEAYEVRLIRRVLDACDWNKSRAAQRFGISRQAFMAKLAKHGIQKPGDTDRG